ncbi:phosphoglucosamine mutase [Chromobacterium sp. IIBBL 290-4]|uniref:phosphoglucosamine mutase n=1 Tax=Chromobacterium sp. IIBBL 290-4 TaxID=2953890 RepID=UPI0020B6E444|nr:phosphoglucosamine mutase [Chromobacterium sp. IIBBL 290-4]UTH72296.1 phosphoglucosamine mutase [Chromobacterium sp. IIBBL 290-4]
MGRKYFGTDGVRGEVGKFPINPEFVMKLGYAAGRVLVSHDKGHRPTVLIGKDTRISGYMLEAALQAGFTAAGVNVLLTGPLPTPGIAYLTRALRLEAGVVISASHNPFQDNGIKFFAEGGKKLDDALELEIEAMLDQPMETNPSLELGRARRIEGAAERYIEFCKSTFPNELSLKGLKVVVDCANGATYHIAPKVFHELGAEVIQIGCQPNGYNINDKVGATYPKTLQLAVLEHQADFGVSLDGDGDRLIMVDAAGRIYDGDQLIYVIAKARAACGELKGGVVGTVMTNMAMELALKQQGVPFGRAKVGDRYVLEMLHADGWQVGGEASGHILCLDKHSTGDGIISSLQVLAAIRQLGRTLAEICADWQPFPQTLINVRHNGCDWKNASAAPLAEAEAALNGRGRVVLRPSGTEPVVRVMVEADDKALADSWAQAIAKAIEKVA